MDASAPEAARRPSIEKTPLVLDQEQPFERLPEEIIEQILQATDPDGFSSLVLLNRKWRHVSQRPHLYRHHLARCSSYVGTPSALPPAEEKNLPRLRRLFAREAKRNLFEPYLRPTETLIKLVSNSISSSSCPGGESLSFSTSLRGHHIMAYDSSRIHVMDARGPTLQVKRELKILRRPASVCITDDASLLAILSTEMQIDIYDLKESPPKRKQSLILDKNPRTIALSSCGSVLAAAYDGGIEVSAIGAGALSTERRAVKCDAVDALTFSFDGTQILGTTLQSSPPSTVVITAPYYDPGALMSDENLSTMWTTSILFPNSSRDCSHAALLQDGQQEAAWAFAYDRSFETFRAVRIDDLRNGTTYFTGPVPRLQAQLLPNTLPAATYNGELVSAAFHNSEIWLYGVPEDPAALPDKDSSSDGVSSGLIKHNTPQNGSRPTSTRANDAPTDRAPHWQMVCDKARNHFVAGHKVSELSGVTNVKWISGIDSGLLKERLVVAARGISVPRLSIDEEDFDFVDGGRLVLLDFEYGLTNGKRTEITIEVGTEDGEVLEEEKRDIETEVAIARRRTVVAQRRGGAAGGAGGKGGGGNSLLRIATGAQSLAAVLPSPHEDDEDDDPLVPRTIGRNPVSARSPAHDEALEEDSRLIEEMDALDAPYAHSSPRSGTTLRRAATAAAANRRLHPRTADGRPIEYHRADGRREHPHESDADQWVPPPPPYQAEDPGDLPAFLRGPAILATNVPENAPPQAQLSLPPNPPTAMNSSWTAQHGGGEHVNQAANVRPGRAATPPEEINLYDVSPPDSPRVSRQHVVEAPISPEQGSALPAVSTIAPSSRRASTSAESTSIVSASEGTGAAPPRLQLQTAVDLSGNAEAANPPPARRLSVSQTWPLSRDASASGSRSAIEPGPEMMGPKVWPGRRASRLGGVGPGVMYHQSSLSVPSLSAPQRQHEIEQPLIISTPAGVSGAYDPPGRRTSRRGETPILAPTPRRPRPGSAGASSRSAVDRLETIFTGNAEVKSTTRLLPGWMAGKPSVSPGRSASVVNRRTSRAGRSAAKNMQDARKRGWKRSKSQKRRKKSTVWTDVPSPRGEEKERKCVLM